MPQAFPAAVTAVGNWLLAWTGGTSAAATAYAYAAANALIYVGVPYAFGRLSESLTPRPKFMSSLNAEYSGTVEPRRIIYGTRRVSGMNVIPPLVSGTNGEYLHQVLAFAGHECDGFDYLHVGENSSQYQASDFTAVTGTANDGKLGGAYYHTNLIWFRFYRGTASQTTDYILDQASSQIDSNFRGRGICYGALQFKYDKKYQTTGKPEISCTIRGKRVYDPRLDVTPGASPTNASYIAFSNNPALCLADYLMDSTLGLGESADRIDWDLVVAAANICDELVAVPSTNQPRYTCNLVVEATDGYQDIIEKICTAMLGHVTYSSGRWQMYAGAWSSSAFTLTEADLAGPVQVEANIPRKDMYNAVRGQYYDAARGYQPMEFNPRTVSAYESTDGERIFREVEFDATTNEYEAQRKGIIITRMSRLRQTVTAEFGLSAFKVRPFEVGTVTIAEIGWTAKTCRCMAWEFTQAGTVKLTLREETSSVWSDPATGDYGGPVSVTAPTPGAFTPAAPTSLTATSVTNGVLLSWSYGELVPGTFFEVWRYTASTPFASATRIATTTSTTYVDANTDARNWFYWVRAAHTNGNTSATEPATNGLSAYRLPAGLFPDPDVQYSATQGLYWDWSVTSPTTVALSASGGVSGGIMQINLGSGSGGGGTIGPVRQFPRAITGDIVELVLRFRRTGTVTGASYAFQLDAGLCASGSMFSPTSGVSAEVIWDSVNSETTNALGQLTGTQINAYTVNQWQEWRVRLRLQNNPKSSTQAPYLYALLTIGNNCSGSVEVDAFNGYVMDDNRTKDGYEIGYRTVPQVQQNATYTFVLTDNGKAVQHTSASAHTWTIPPNSSVAFPVGAVITLEAGSSSGNVTVAPDTGVTLRQAGTTNTGNRTLAANGLATLMKVGTDEWKISGAGVT